MSSTRCGVVSCQIEQRNHAQRWVPGFGWHSWIAPTKEQITQRLKERYGIVQP